MLHFKIDSPGLRAPKNLLADPAPLATTGSMQAFPAMNVRKSGHGSPILVVRPTIPSQRGSDRVEPNLRSQA